MNRALIAGVIALTVSLCCCCPATVVLSSDSADSQQQLLYRDFLNMETPAGLSDFQGEGVGYWFPLPAFMSHGYFTYTADTIYFEQLEAHNRFPVESGFNRQIQQMSCDHMPHNFSFWEEDGFSGEIDLEDKVCFWGTFVPYNHYIVYDPSTKQVHHFVAGMRD
jgi:hypothetical protein